MIIKENLILLTTAENYPLNGDYFPDITHVRLVNFKTELPRPNDNKFGYIDMWFSKGYIYNSRFYEGPGLLGLNFKVEEPEIFDMAQIQCQAAGIMSEVEKTILQYMIDTGRIAGTLIVNEYEV